MSQRFCSRLSTNSVFYGTTGGFEAAVLMGWGLILWTGFWLSAIGATNGTLPNRVLKLKFKRIEPTVPEHILQWLRRQREIVNGTCGAECHSEVVSRAAGSPVPLEAAGLSFIDISLGTPSQKFRVWFDTATPELWIGRQIGCSDDNKPKSVCKNPTFKEPSESTKISDEPMQMSYGTGKVQGVWADEGNMFIGDSKCKSKAKVGGDFKFGLASRIRGFAEMSGILGMGFIRPKEFRSADTIYGDSLMQKMVDGGMDGKFSTWARQCHPPTMGNKCKNGGVVTFGAFDTEHCGKELATVEVVNSMKVDEKGVKSDLGFPTYWRFKANGMWMEMEDGKSEDFMRDAAFEVITNTGSTVFRLPPKVFEKFRELLPKSCETAQSYSFCPCDIKFTFFLKVKEAVIPVTSERLLLKLNEKEPLCQVLIGNSQKEDFYALGDPFIRSVCHHYHWTDRKITFAEMK